jgi:hypothetical protein
MKPEPHRTRLETISLEDPHSLSDSEVEGPDYVFCNSRGRLDRLTNLIQSILSKPHHWKKPFVFLAAQGHNLGRTGGKLGLVQIGVHDEIFLLDILTYSKNLEIVRTILENPDIEKYMWNGRDAVAEFWHGHDIMIESAIDLQLVHIHDKVRKHSATGSRGFLPAENMETAFLKLPKEIIKGTRMDVRMFNRSIPIFNCD